MCGHRWAIREATEQGVRVSIPTANQGVLFGGPGEAVLRNDGEARRVLLLV